MLDTSDRHWKLSLAVHVCPNRKMHFRQFLRAPDVVRLFRAVLSTRAIVTDDDKIVMQQYYDTHATIGALVERVKQR